MSKTKVAIKTGATNRNGFSATFFEPTAENWLTTLKASSALPYLYKKGKKFILKSSNNHNLNKIKIIGNFHESINSKKQKKIIKKFKLRFRTTSLDALSYCLLAEGKVDAVLEANLKPHDILPLIPIIENSRAIVTNWNNKSAKNGGNILASSNRKLHNKILRLLKPFVKKND